MADWKVIKKVEKEEYMVIFYQKFTKHFDILTDNHSILTSPESLYRIVIKYAMEKRAYYRDIDTIESGECSKDFANYVYWNLTNRRISKDDITECILSYSQSKKHLN